MLQKFQFILLYVCVRILSCPNISVVMANETQKMRNIFIVQVENNTESNV